MPRRVAQARARRARRRTEHPAVSIGVPRVVHNASDGGIAPFSSRGLAFDGRVKPDLAAPGVALATSEPGANDDGTPRFGTVNGSSAAAAVVAGAAAVLAQARPGLRALELRSLLVGTGALVRDDERHRRRAPAWSTSARRGRRARRRPGHARVRPRGGRRLARVAAARRPQRLVAHAARPRPQHRGSGGLRARARSPHWVRLKPGGTRAGDA